MISRYEAYLNGVALSSVSADILILDVEYPTPTIRTETFSVARRQGLRVHRQYIEKTSVTISFTIRNYDTRARQSICGAVAKWAKNGGILTINDRVGQRLRCVCDTPPMISSALRWGDTLRLVFVAYSLPFWEEVVPSVLQLSGTQENGLLFVPGDVDGAMVEATITANAALTTVTLGVNNLEMVLSGLSISSGQSISITYDDNMIQSIKVGTTSLLNKRTGADDLLVNCGEVNSFSISADASVTVNFSVRWLWL